MEYNTAREKMAIPEYGRNVQKMVKHVIGLEDREARTRAAKQIINVMANMNPQIKESSDYEHMLWDHLYIISDFQLDVDSPFPAPEKKNIMRRPDRLTYSEDHIRYKHYGMHLEKMIKHAIEMEEGEEKKELTRLIANQMKKSYLNWNRNTVSDQMIINQLEELSGGKLKLDEGEELIATQNVMIVNRSTNKKKKNNQRRDNNGRKRNYGHKNY